ncbi:MAG: pancreas/duodenum homeobox protein 1 [Deltaproteobacteria bacterium]|nr:pancreas/duodenum homeobox protein 1 [Deltaproteobacteria bacterium]
MAENEELKDLFTREDLKSLFPEGRDNMFFESLFGDADEGAFDIRLSYKALHENALHLEFQLRQRPGKCLACNLTYGLPQVFKRHPVINVNGVVEEIGKRLDGKFRCSGWELGATRELSRELHVIPLFVSLEPSH